MPYMVAIGSLGYIVYNQVTKEKEKGGGKPKSGGGKQRVRDAELRIPMKDVISYEEQTDKIVISLSKR